MIKKLLSNATESHRALPRNLKEVDKYLFINELKRSVNEVYLLKIPNITMQYNGIVLLRNGQVIADEFYYYNSIQKLSYFSYYKHQFKQYLRNRYKKIGGPLVFVVDVWSIGYFHWMAEVLPRLITAMPEIKECTVILPEIYITMPFVKDSLKLLELKVFYLIKANTYKLKDVWFPSHFCGTGNYSDRAIQKTRQIFRERGCAQSCNSKKRLFISRSKAIKRNITNEDELLIVLNQYEFEVVHCEDLSFNQQLAIFYNASAVISNHGAGLTNMLFMVENSFVIELRHENDNQNNCYFSLASALNLEYFYQLCTPVNSKEDYHSADVLVNISEIKKLLQSVFDLQTIHQPIKE